MSLCTPCPELTVDIDGNVGDIPASAIEDGKRLLNSVLVEFPAKSRILADLVRIRTRGRFHRESVAYANIVERSWREVVLANIAYDLALAIFGCSTMAVATGAGPVLSRNMDFWPEELLAQGTYKTKYLRGGERVMMTAGWPGSIGVVTGMSDKGFAIALNAVAGDEGLRKTGYPVLFFLRCVLEDAGGFEEAVEMLRKKKLTVGALVTVVGKRNEERVVIERTPSRCAMRWAEGDEPLIVTNDYRALNISSQQGKNRLYESACGRFEALEELARELPREGRVPTKAFLYCLTDERVKMSITAQHMVFRPSEGEGEVFVPSEFLN